MKKIASILLVALVLQACDDGDITLQSFDFSSQSVQECTDNNLIFKTKNDELLLIDIPETNFLNEETPDGEPRVVTVSSTNQIIYRKYSGTVNSTSICADIPPATPVVSKEWVATGGTILIETNIVYETDGVTINSYTHNIKFVNVNFAGTDDSFSFEEYIFGDYTTYP